MNLVLSLLLVAQSIEFVSSAVYSGADRKLVVAGSRLYSACERGLDIFDITQPESIRMLGHYDTPGIANGVAVQDTLAYVADNYNGLLVLSVADPANPRLLGRAAISSITDVAVKDTLAFVGGNDLMAYSVADPAAPRRIGTLSGVSTYRLAVYDTFCFVAAQAGLVVVSVANPGAMRTITTLPTSWLRDVEVKGGYAFCAGDTELLVYDAKTLARVGGYDAGYLSFGVGVGDSLVLVCRGQQMDIRVLSIANPANPVYRGSFTAQNGPQDAAVSGTWGFAGVWSRDLLCADLSNPAAPSVRGRVLRPGELNGAWRDGNLVATADRWYGLSVVDVTDIEHPVERGNCTLSGYPRRLVLRDTVAYVANYDGLACVGLSDPDHPHLLGQVTTPYYAYKVTLYDTIAYVAEREWNPYHGNLHCVSVADPRNPRILGTYSTNGGGVEAVAHKVKDFAYVVSQGWDLNEFAIVNVRDPTAPFRVSGCNTNGYPVDVDAAGDYAFALITSPNQRIEVISIADTLSPAVVAERALTNGPIALYVRDPYLFVSYYYYGIEVFDISNPLNMVSLGTYNTTGNSFGSFVDEDLYVYLADAHSLQMLRFAPAGVEELPVAARDAPGIATVCRGTLRLPRGTTGRISLFDAAGRVALARDACAGTVDLHGLTAGVYVFRLQAGGKTSSGKLVLQR
jgi:hypothetical protein